MQSRKTIITISGVILFLLAGSITMFMTPPESPAPKPAPKQSTQPIPQTPPPAPQPQPEPQKAREPATWYVYVTGEVENPGVYPLPENSRMFAAINAAGGFTKNADGVSLNLAEFLTDEAHIHVPAKSERRDSQPLPQNAPQVVRVPGSAGIVRSATNSGLIDINRADLQELQRINGVGPSIAQRIIDYRNQHGSFSRVEDLLNVKGIGNTRLNQIRNQVTVSGGSSYTSPSTTHTSTNTHTNSGLVDINRANLQELQRIKGVGPATAQRIIDYRNSHGSFSRAEDLLNVRGIGASKLNQIRTQITIR